MATIQIESGRGYAHPASGIDSVMRRPFFPAIRWGAVLAGVAVGVSMQLLLTLLGIAIGLSATSVTRGETVGTGSLLWAGLSLLVSAFVGGYVAARMTGFKRKTDGILHGVVSWAVTTLLFATLATSAGGTLLSGVFRSMNIGVAASASGGGSPIASLLRGQIGADLTPTALQTLQQYIQAGRRDDAVQFMVGSMGVSSARATAIVDQALILSGSPEQASPLGRATADRAIGAANTAAWAVFIAVTLSLAMGIAGGVFGAVGARRTTWSDTGAAPANPS
jgi:hypothetical protein